MPKVKFNCDYCDYRKSAKKFGKLTAQEEQILRKRINYFQQQELSDFLQGSAKPRLWHEKPPSTPPSKLSTDIIDGGLFRINLTQKIRLFAYKYNEVFFIIWIDPTHKSGN